jgi:5-(carboxyamino)imidazole ribonucleotide mutase
MGKPLVGVIMGSDSDLQVMRAATLVLEQLDIPCETTIVSAHRTPKRLVDYAAGAESRGIKVIIAGAGGAAHLPGMVASMTLIPVIGVPVKSSNLNGLDSLLSIVQMPAGIPVATVAINGAQNAGLLAARILGIHDPALMQRLELLSSKQTEQVLEKAAALESIGVTAFMEGRKIDE